MQHKFSVFTYGRIMTSRLKYSRNALCINTLLFARYFRQRYAPFIRPQAAVARLPLQLTAQTITKLRSDMICFWHYKTCLHERGTAIRRYCK